MKMQFSLPAAELLVSNFVLPTTETRLLHSIADVRNLYDLKGRGNLMKWFWNLNSTNIFKLAIRCLRQLLRGLRR